MSFTTFGPLPTPPRAPLSGLPGLVAAIQRLEATIPVTPASRDAGAASSTARQVAAALLAGVDPDARPHLQQVFEQTLEAVEADLALPPERRRLVPVPYQEQYEARPCSQTANTREHDQKGLDRLLRQALWRVVDALEALALLPPGEVYQVLLAEHCAQFTRMYRELKRRAGGYFAPILLHGELRLLHHRGSAAVKHLLFN